MAGDWIKMRGELVSHPKLLTLANELIYGNDPGLLLYVCGSDALDIGVCPPSDESVTERALRIVTERALRDVTLASLIRVWCAVDSHCKVDGDDAILCPSSINDLDLIAGFSGFGAAMLVVSWVVEECRNVLRFPNFLEFNEPACLRKTFAMSGAERTAKWRMVKKAQRAVTTVTKCDAREEKIREEKIREEKSILSLGKKESKKDPPTPRVVDIPAELSNADFIAAWDDWIRYRRSRRITTRPETLSRQLASLAPLGPSRAAACIEESIRNGWQGVFPEKSSARPEARKREIVQL